MTRNAELFDAMLKVAVGVLILAAWTYVVLDQRDLRRALRRQRTQLHQHRRAIVQLQGAATQPPTSIGQPMPTVGRPVQGGWVNAQPWGKENGPELTVTQAGLRSLRANESRAATACTTGTDATLRLARPPAMTDVAAAITTAARPLTRAAITEQLGRDARTEIREQLLAGTLTMVRTHDSEPAYWLAGDTHRMGRMSVLPGVSQLTKETHR